MTDRLRQAFDQIHAEEALKARTREAVFQRAHIQAVRTKPARRRLAVLSTACAMLALVFIGGYWAYFTATSIVSIDINPSLELGVNRFDRVVSVEGYNEDGAALAQTLDLKYLSYSEALDRILTSDEVAGYLTDDAVMSIAVAGENQQQCGEILAQTEHCTAGRQNVHCSAGSSTELEQAHEHGLSLGKYQALLQLQSLDPEITAEDIQNMSMREIQDWIAALMNDGQSTASGTATGEQNYGHGYGHGQHHGTNS